LAPCDVRQPQVARLTVGGTPSGKEPAGWQVLSAFLLALLLVAPVLRAAWNGAVAAAFLVEFLTHAPLLTAMTLTPVRGPLGAPGVAADLYIHTGWTGGARLVLVHGFAPQGKDESRVRDAAALLARAGFDVAVPTIAGLTRGRLGLDDVETVVAALAGHAAPTVVIGVSVGAGPALLAAADPRVRDRVSAVLSLGGYASGLEVVRFWLTGTYEFGGVRGRVSHDPELVRMFVRANADVLDPPSRALLESGEPEKAARFLTALPPELQRHLDALSPLRVARDIPARLVLVHGYQDRAVPYTESLRLAAARPDRTALVLVGIVEHVEGGGRGGWREAGDLLALWRVMYGLLT